MCGHGGSFLPNEVQLMALGWGSCSSLPQRNCRSHTWGAHLVTLFQTPIFIPIAFLFLVLKLIILTFL
jgi:hypothetical protein